MAWFATEKYHLGQTYGDMFMHLTNYAINKQNSSNYNKTDKEGEEMKFKWTKDEVFEQMEWDGVDTYQLWLNIE